MMASILHETSMQKVLASQSTLNPKHRKWKKTLAADLLLTALIDAFSILVIFLLMSFSSTGDILFINKGMELPKASVADNLERNLVVKIDEGKIFLEDKEVSVEGLIEGLIGFRKSFAETHPQEEPISIATVQADRRIKYEFLNQVVLALAHAGYSDIRFAVMMQ